MLSYIKELCLGEICTFTEDIFIFLIPICWLFSQENMNATENVYSNVKRFN